MRCAMEDEEGRAKVEAVLISDTGENNNVLEERCGVVGLESPGNTKHLCKLLLPSCFTLHLLSRSFRRSEDAEGGDSRCV